MSSDLSPQHPAPRTPPREMMSARARRRVADIEDRFRTLTTVPMRRGLVATAAASVLAVSALVHPWVTVPVLAGLIVWFATGWMRLLGLPSVRRGQPLIVALGWVALLAALGATDHQRTVLIVAAGMVAAFLVQMSRRDGRPRLVEDLSGIVAGTIAAVSSAGWVVAAEVSPIAVVTAAGALAATSVLSALPLRGPVVITLGPLVGAVGGLIGALAALSVLGALGVPTLAVGWVKAVMLAAAVGLTTAMLQVMLSWLPRSGRKRPAASAALLPVLLVGVPLELVLNLLVA